MIFRSSHRANATSFSRHAVTRKNIIAAYSRSSSIAAKIFFSSSSEYGSGTSSSIVGSRSLTIRNGLLIPASRSIKTTAMTLFSDRLRCGAILLKSVDEVAEDAATALRIVELVDVLRGSLAEEFVQDVGVIFDCGLVLTFLDFEELSDGSLEGDAAVSRNGGFAGFNLIAFYLGGLKGL